MGCCVSKKRGEPPGAAGEAQRSKVVEARDLAPPEEEKVKEVLSETPRVKPRRVAGAVVAPSAEKVSAMKEGDARAKDVCGGDRVGRRAARPARSIEEKSEAASESSVATTATGPERSPSKPPRYTYRQGATSGAEPRRARRDRDRVGAVPGGRASPSPPPPRCDPGRRSPSPAAKRSQDQRRDTASSCAQRKPPVPARPGGRTPAPRRAQEAPPQPSVPAQPHEPTHCASPPAPEAPLEDAPPGSDVTDGAGDGEGKESLENPLVSMECFIFL